MKPGSPAGEQELGPSDREELMMIKQVTDLLKEGFKGLYFSPG